MSAMRAGTGRASRGALALAFAAPLVAMGLPIIVSSTPGPMVAQADAMPELGEAPSSSQRAGTESLAARARALELRAAVLPEHSPLRPASEEAPMLPAMVEVLEPDELTPGVVIPTFAVSAIMQDADGRALAVVNGKLHASGSVLGEGWTITRIDVQTRTVNFTDGAGNATSATLTMPDMAPAPREPAPRLRR